jgi:hypothetical protein
MESEVVLAATDNRPNDNAHVRCGGPAPKAPDLPYTFFIPNIHFFKRNTPFEKNEKKDKKPIFFSPSAPQNSA